MILYLLVIAVAAGIVFGGRLSGFVDFRLNKPYLFIAGFLLQAITVSHNSIYFQAAVYALLLLGFWCNRQYYEIWITALGTSLNFAAIIANGGRMPVSVKAMETIGKQDRLLQILSGVNGKHMVADSSTHLVFLTDVIPARAFPVFLSTVYSAGDIFIGVGISLLLFNIVKGNRKHSR